MLQRIKYFFLRYWSLRSQVKYLMMMNHDNCVELGFLDGGFTALRDRFEMLEESHEFIEDQFINTKKRVDNLELGRFIEASLDEAARLAALDAEAAELYDDPEGVVA